MVVYQGPILNSNMELGATGFWNNIMRPNVYYLNNKNGYFEATRAEIVSDIDGKYLKLSLLQKSIYKLPVIFLIL